MSIRRLRYQQIEALYDALLHPTTSRGLAPKTVYEIHLMIKGALADALRRGLVTRNVAVVARAPKQRSLQRIEGVSLTEEELRQLMPTAVGHRLFPLVWLTAMTGMRRNEVLGAPNCGPHVMHEAYSHEVSSAGYWPGPDGEGVFYSYAYPAPHGFEAAEIDVPHARYDAELGEFTLPYEAVRTASDPDELMLSFVRATYEAAADLAGWDRRALERPH